MSDSNLVNVTVQVWDNSQLTFVVTNKSQGSDDRLGDHPL